jgi:hypothetical protein
MEEELRGSCSTRGGDEKCVQLYNVKRGLGVGGRIIFKMELGDAVCEDAD